MLGMSNLSVNGCAFGDVSTGVDVEGPATERGARCSVGNATGRVSFWLSSGVCDGDYDGSVGLIRCLVGRDERDGIDERLRVYFNCFSTLFPSTC